VGGGVVAVDTSGTVCSSLQTPLCLKIPNSRARPGALYPRPERVFSFVYGKITNNKKALQYKKALFPARPAPCGQDGDG
jgi:hypothetical protein